MELTLEEKVVLELMRALETSRGSIDRLSLEKLVFLVAHGEFNEKGELIGLRTFPRIEVDYRIYFRGVHSRDVYEIVERLADKGLVKQDGNKYKIAINPSEPLSLPREIESIIRLVEKYASLSPRDLERLTNELLGIKDEVAKTLVFNASVVKLLKAREDARRLREQGLLVDV